jgi:type II secretion system protein G
MNKINKKNPPTAKAVMAGRGFTLIELLVVIAIVGILVFITSSSFVNSQQRSRDASRKTELKSLADALNMYYADNGLFPEMTVMQGLINDGSEFSDNSNPNNEIIYMKKVPQDSRVSGGRLQFKYMAGSKSFRLYANLENSDDIDCQSSCLTSEYNVANGCCYVVISSNIGVTEALK